MSDGRATRTTDELVAAVRACVDSLPCEAAAVVGLTGPRVDGVEQTDLSSGEGPISAAMQSVLKHSDSAALVVFTDCPPPQWVVQPCFLLREVAVVANPVEPRT